MIVAKRFTDSEKWQKPWFRKLPPSMKLVWFYLLDSCDIAGVWAVDMELVSFFVGAEVDTSDVLSCFGCRIVVFDSGKKWFVRDFIDFQYGPTLNPSNRLHNSVLCKLDKYGLDKENLGSYEGPSEDLVSPLQGAKDKDKVKDKVKVLLEGGAGGNQNKPARLIPPSRDDAVAYALSIDLPETEVDKYLDYYTANGWKVGRNPMKDWKSAMRNWKRNSRNFAAPSQQTRTNERIPFTLEAINEHDQRTKQAYAAYDARRNQGISGGTSPEPDGLPEHRVNP